jgi:multimeric flavodoxin WrbA
VHTLVDLRAKQDAETYKAIQDLFDEPLKIVRLEEQSIKSCTGCWSCWLKTPGKCVLKDQMVETYTDYVNSDTIILLMSTAQGFINHQAKAFLDRTIPHYHPYIIMADGECRHLARYASYPDLVFYYDREGMTDLEKQVLDDYLYRTACHHQSKAYIIVNDGSFQLRLLKPGKPRRGNLPFASVEAMEKLVIYNGSPRKRGSNSALILEKVAEALGEKVEVRDLKERDNWEVWAADFKNEEHVMFFMPLYVHAMPSHVMEFIERLQPSKGSISFFIQSGFPESSQSHYLEAYVEQLALRLSRTYLGTAIKGGVEGMQMRPPAAQEKMIEPIVKAIHNLVCNGSFNPDDIRRLAKPVRFGKGTQLIFKLVARFGLVNYFWDHQLKNNDAYEKRFDRPYLS